MSLKMIKPIDITDDILTSTIAEPDASQGEVEWVDSGVMDSFGSVSENYWVGVTAGDGLQYWVGNTGNVLEIDSENDSTTTFGSYLGSYTRATLALNGKVYCISSTGILIIDVASKTVLEVVDPRANAGAFLIDAGNGFIYWTDSDTISIYKMSISDNSVYTVGVTLGPIYTGSITSEGVIYCAGDSDTMNQVVKVDTSNDTVSNVGSYYTDIFTSTTNADDVVVFGGNSSSVHVLDSSADKMTPLDASASASIFSSSVLNTDGSVYLVGSTNGVIGVVSSGLTFTYFGDDSYSLVGAFFRVYQDGYGNMYSVSINGDVLFISGSKLTTELLENVGNGSRNFTRDSQGRLCTVRDAVISRTRLNYEEGDQVILAETHKIYQASTQNRDKPSDGVLLTPPSWVEVSATNKYKAFDYVINTKSTMTASTDKIELSPLQPATYLAMFGLDNVTIATVKVYEDDSSGSLIYSESKSLVVSAPVDDLIVNDELLGSKVLFDDLPVYATPYIEITFQSNETEIQVGDIAIGNARSLGLTTYSSSTSRTSYDTVEYDTFGNVTTVSRPSAEYTSFEVVVLPDYADYVERILKDSLNKPRIWSSEKLNGEKLFTFGYYERSPITYTSPTQYNTNLKIRGLV